MSVLARIAGRISQIFEYWRYLRQRKARLKKAQKEDPNIYPLW
jgi:hypothetical protein